MEDIENENTTRFRRRKAIKNINLSSDEFKNYEKVFKYKSKKLNSLKRQ